jgi:hypothetical protein
MAWKKIIVSGSSAELASANIDGAIVATQITGSTNFDTIVNKPTLVSGSTQVDITDTTGYTAFSSSISESIAAKPSTWETLENKPAGIVSSSEQTVGNLVNQDVNLGTGAVTASYFKGDGSGLENLDIAQVATIVRDFTDVTEYTVTHNFGTKNVMATVYDSNDFQIFPASIQAATDNTVVVTFDITSSGTVIVGKGGHVVSGSVPFSNIIDVPTLVSSSAQVNDLFEVTDVSASIDSRLGSLEVFSSSLDSGFATDAELNASSSTLQSNIDTAESNATAALNASSSALITYTDDEITALSASAEAARSTLASSLTLSGSSGNDVVNLKTDTLSVVGTANEIETTVTNNQIQIGIVSNPILTGDVTITGNLNVTGDTIQAQVSNINVEDRFILLNSGSTTGDSGIVFGGSDGSANQGSGIFWDSPANIFGFSQGISAEDTTATHTSKLGNIQVASADPTATPTFQGVGSIAINDSDEGIWIYS